MQEIAQYLLRLGNTKSYVYQTFLLKVVRKVVDKKKHRLWLIGMSYLNNIPGFYTVIVAWV